MFVNASQTHLGSIFHEGCLTTSFARFKHILQCFAMRYIFLQGCKHVVRYFVTCYKCFTGLVSNMFCNICLRQACFAMFCNVSQCFTKFVSNMFCHVLQVGTDVFVKVSKTPVGAGRRGFAFEHCGSDINTT